MRSWFCGTAIMASVVICSAMEPSAGSYYTVPMTVLSDTQELMNRTTGTVLAYPCGNQTTCVQLMSTGGHADSRSFVINRSDLPEELSYLFGSMPSLRIDHFQGALKDSEELIIDLVDDQGNPRGTLVQLLGPDNQPLTNVAVEYLLRDKEGDVESTGTVKLMDDGSFLIPQYPGPGRMFWSRIKYRFKVTELKNGTSVVVPPKDRWMSDKDPVTTISVPFVDNFDAPPPGVETYSAQMLNANGSPVTETAIKASRANVRQEGAYYGPIEVTPGPEGKINLAFKKPDEPDKPNQPHGVFLDLDTKLFGFGLINMLHPGEHKTLQAAQVVTVELLDEAGLPYPLERTTPTDELSPFSGIGTLLSSDTTKPFFNGLKFDETQSGPVLKPMALEAGASYVAKVDSRIFGPARLEHDVKKLTLKLSPVPFSVTGRIVDIAGNAVNGAYIVLRDTFRTRSAYSVDSAAAIWEQTKGEFSELGYYMTRSDEKGDFHIEGDYLSQSAALGVFAEGKLPGPFHMVNQTTATVIGMDLQMERLIGNKRFGTLTVNDLATATVVIDAIMTTSPHRISPGLGFSVFPQLTKTEIFRNNDGTTGVLRKNWLSKATSDTVKWTFPVPAETTFTVSLMGTGFDGRVTTTVQPALKTGTVRDLGVLKPEPEIEIHPVRVE